MKLGEGITLKALGVLICIMISHGFSFLWKRRYRRVFYAFLCKKAGMVLKNSALINIVCFLGIMSNKDLLIAK